MRKNKGARITLSPNNEVRSIESVAQEDDVVLPAAAELERLHRFRPDLVDVSIEEFKKETEFQRKRMTRVDYFLFAERIIALLAAVGLTCCAFWVAYLFVSAGAQVAACVVAGGTLGSIVAAILKNR